jgi:hypothetical protein
MVKVEGLRVARDPYVGVHTYCAKNEKAKRIFLVDKKISLFRPLYNVYFRVISKFSEFLEGLKREIPRYRRMARAHFDWNALDGAKDYDDTLRAHQERRQHDPTLREPAYTNWLVGRSSRAWPGAYLLGFR